MTFTSGGDGNGDDNDNDNGSGDDLLVVMDGSPRRRRRQRPVLQGRNDNTGASDMVVAPASSDNDSRKEKRKKSKTKKKKKKKSCTKEKMDKDSKSGRLSSDRRRRRSKMKYIDSDEEEDFKFQTTDDDDDGDGDNDNSHNNRTEKQQKTAKDNSKDCPSPSSFPASSPSSIKITSTRAKQPSDMNNVETLQNFLPLNLTSPSQLKWHKQYISPLSSSSSLSKPYKPIYRPCRIISQQRNSGSNKSTNNKLKQKKKKETKHSSWKNDSSLYDSNSNSSESDNDDHNTDSDGDDDDDDGEVQIEYLYNLNYYQKSKSAVRPNTKFSQARCRTVSKKRLLPYYNVHVNNQTNDANNYGMDYNDISSSKWCATIYGSYRRQLLEQQKDQKNHSLAIYHHHRHLQQQRRQNRKRGDGIEEREELIELKFLNRILDVAKKRAGYKLTDRTATTAVSREHGDNDKIDNSRSVTNNKMKHGDPRNKDSRGESSLIEPHSEIGRDSDGDLIEPFDDLEEPYTQQIDYKAMGYNSSDEEMEIFCREMKRSTNTTSVATAKRGTGRAGTNENSDSNVDSSFEISPKKKRKNQHDRNKNNNSNSSEPIRPGDVLEYYSPIFVYGDKRGKRTATVISVDPKNKNSILKLSNNECLPIDVRVRRIKILVEDERRGGTGISSNVNSNSYSKRWKDDKGHGGRVDNIQRSLKLIDHPGIFREIQEFKLVKLNPIKGYHIETERDRVRNILQSNMDKFQRDAEASGFAPMDMMNSFGRKHGGRGRAQCNNNNYRTNEKDRAPRKDQKKDVSYSSSSDSDNDLLRMLEEKQEKKRSKRMNQSPSPSVSFKHQVSGKESQTSPPLTTFKRKVTESDASPSPGRGEKKQKASLHDDESSDEDDEILRKINSHCEALSRGKKEVRDHLHLLQHKSKRGKDDMDKSGDKSRGLLSSLSLRDTDEDEGSEDIFNENRASPTSGETSSALHQECYNRNYKHNNRLRSLTNEYTEPDIDPTKGDDHLSLCSSRDNDDSDDEEIEPLSFPKGSSIRDELRMSKSTLKGLHSEASFATKNKSPTSNYSTKGLTENVNSLAPSDSDESMSSFLYENMHAISSSVPAQPKENNRVINSEKYRYSPKSTHLHSCGLKQGRQNGTREQSNRGRQTVSSVKPMKFKLFKHN